MSTTQELEALLEEYRAKLAECPPEKDLHRRPKSTEDAIEMASWRNLRRSLGKLIDAAEWSVRMRKERERRTARE